MKIKSKILLTFLLVPLIFKASGQKFIQQGAWRGEFTTNEGLHIPFNFEVKGTSADKAKIYLINGDEKFEVKRLKQVKDSLFISFDDFDNELAVKIEGQQLTGVLRKQEKNEQVKPSSTAGTPISVDKTGLYVPFTAKHGISHRFEDKGIQPERELTGKWDVTFITEDGKESKSVGIFKQTGNKLTGTFLRITGDYRYLEGIVQGNQFYLSSFIGTGPVLISGSIDKENTLTGTFGGPSGKFRITGIRNENAELPDPYTLTYLKEGYKKFDFTFPDLKGNKVSLSDAKYKNKVVIVTITGTWCPNCVDEAAFLAPWFKKNHDRGVEAVAIYYERKTDPDYVQKVLGRFKEKHGIEYDQVFAGLADKKLVAESLPSLNTFLSFPTTLFINKNGDVAKIHTGYTGPATGKYYESFIREFNAEVDKLLAETPEQAKASTVGTRE